MEPFEETNISCLEWELDVGNVGNGRKKTRAFFLFVYTILKSHDSFWTVAVAQGRLVQVTLWRRGDT